MGFAERPASCVVPGSSLIQKYVAEQKESWLQRCPLGVHEGKPCAVVFPFWSVVEVEEPLSFFTYLSYDQRETGVMDPGLYCVVGIDPELLLGGIHQLWLIPLMSTAELPREKHIYRLYCGSPEDVLEAVMPDWRKMRPRPE